MLLSVVFLGFGFIAIVQGQELPPKQEVCLDPEYGTISFTIPCQSPLESQGLYRTQYNGVCVVLNPDGSGKYALTLPEATSDPKYPGLRVNKNGDTCEQISDSKEVGPFFRFVPQPPVGTPPNPGGNPKPTPTPTPGTKPTPQAPCGDEKGFHMVGPLCVPNSPFNHGLAGDPSSQTAAGLAARIIKILLYFAGIVAVIMCIIGGYQIMTAAGNAVQATNGRKTLTNAIIGLIIVILSYVLVQTVISFVTK